MRRSYRWIAAGSAVCVLGIIASVATGLTRAEWEEILGPPSKVPMKGAARKQDVARQKDARATAQYTEKGSQHRQQVAKLIRELPSAKAVQNLTIEVRNPRNESIAGLLVAAEIQGKDGTTKTRSLQTNSAGRVRIEGIGPLPGSAKLAFAPGTNAPDGKPEWVAASPYDTEILIRTPMGKKVALLPQDEPTWSSPGIVFASLTLAALSTAPSSRVAAYEAVYERPVVVQRNAVDLELSGPPGASVFVAAPDTERLVGKVEDTGELRFQLATASFTEGVPPLRLVQEIQGGEREAVVAEYPHDPYAGVNRVGWPGELRLVRVREVRIARGLDVLASASDIRRALGDPGGRGRPAASISKQVDGSEWWRYDAAGLWFKVRRGEIFGSNFKDGIVERVRIVGQEGGGVAGIRAGDEWSAVERAFGVPEDRVTGSASYLDGGLVFGSSGDRVAWIETARPTELLEEGTTAFVRRPPIRVYVSSLRSDARCQISTTDQFKRYLGQMGVVRIVTSEDDADYVLSAATTFEDAKDEFLDVVPLKYRATTRLTYIIQDRLENRYIAQNETINGVSEASYKREAALGAVIILLIERYMKGDSGAKRLLEIALGVGGIDALKKSMGRAIQRCPGISEQAAFNALSDQLYALADFKARVISIDYDRGLLTFNVGTADGVVIPRTGQQPTLFELSLGRTSYPVQETGLSANYYAAEVVSAAEHTCVAQMKHVVRRIRKSREELEVKTVPEVARQIPDPTTGIVSGRIRVRFLPLSGEVGQ